jgi:hypothetical protein
MILKLGKKFKQTGAVDIPINSNPLLISLSHSMMNGI